ncbi:hypothetical protein H0P51_18395 [Mycobacterium vicinigordonae]|uniref:Lipoprotein n=1 Tax=Mycobacterium vicinigordonae TaxID=1719132 RepID=A0A7D6E6H6_9MYCO|nr:hypothetical protein H0P51_18395 [Mycobacterium vicinigordonae]
MRTRVGAAVLTMMSLVAGCTQHPSTPNSAPTARPAAEPAIAPAPGAPVGTVVPTGDIPEGIVIGTSGVGAVAVRNPDGIELFDAATGVRRQLVPTRGSARHLSLVGPDGPVLVPLEATNELWELSLADGHVLRAVTGVGHQPHDAARTAGDTIVVTNEHGGGVVLVRGGVVVASLPAGPVQPGGVAAVGNYAAVADVQGNGVWVYDGPAGRQVAQGPVGVKLTHAVALGGDRAAFADTDGGAVLIERVDPQLTGVAKVDAPGKPYGLAYDGARRRLYVTLTASNQVRVIDLPDPGKPRILGDVATVRQPNSVAVDPHSGTVVVTGSLADGGGTLQVITPELLPAT